MTRTLCANCARRPAETLDDIDGRRYAVCYRCRDGEVADPVVLTPIDRVVRAVARNPGATVGELAEALGEPEHMGIDRVRSNVRRAIVKGRVRGIGTRNERLYYPAT